jgi:hypothetical protein
MLYALWRSGKPFVPITIRADMTAVHGRDPRCGPSTAMITLVTVIKVRVNDY